MARLRDRRSPGWCSRWNTRDGGGPTLLGGVKEAGGVGHPRTSTLTPRISESPVCPPDLFDPIFANQPTHPALRHPLPTKVAGAAIWFSAAPPADRRFLLQNFKISPASAGDATELGQQLGRREPGCAAARRTSDHGRTMKKTYLIEKQVARSSATLRSRPRAVDRFCAVGKCFVCDTPGHRLGESRIVVHHGFR